MLVQWLLLLASCGCLAFDIGHHNDVAVSVLLKLGYSTDAISLVRFGTFAVDYFSYFLPTKENQIADFQKLHADSIFTGAQAEAYFQGLINNVRFCLNHTSIVSNEQDFLLLLGLTLHVTADIHAHATWGQRTGLFRSSCDCFSDESFWTATGASGLNMRTGTCTLCDIIELTSRVPVNNSDDYTHGDYCKGLNRDSYARPNFEEAYVGAFLTSLQWVSAFEAWTTGLGRASLVTAAKAWVATTAEYDDLVAEVNFAERLSMFAKLPTQSFDGHWKGPGSGSTDDFATFLASSLLHSDAWRDKTRAIRKNVTQSLYTSWPSRDPALWPSTINTTAPMFTGWNVIVLRGTHFVAKKKQILDGDDPYLLVTINGQKFKETIMIDQSVVDPYWRTIAFVPSDLGTVGITIEAWDYDGPINADDQYDINPDAGKLGLTLTYNVLTHVLSGDITGAHDTDEATASSTGDGTGGNAATLEFTIRTKSIGACVGTSAISCPEPPLPELCSHSPMIAPMAWVLAFAIAVAFF